MAEGSITIETLLTTDKFEKQVNDLENKIKKKEKEKIEIDVELQDIKKQVNDFNQLIAKAEEYEKVVKQIQDTQSKRTAQGLKPLKLTDSAKNIMAEYGEMQSYIEKNASSMEKLATKGNKLLEKQKEINSEISTYKAKIESIKLEKQTSEIQKLKNGFKDAGSSIQDAINKVSKLALGIFGVRSAYMALRRASSDLATYDEQYATNLEYIRFVLTQSIAPVLKWIINLAATLLQYIYAILNAWFGIGSKLDLSAKAFQKMKSGASGVSKAVKEIRRDLLGFDEITKLNEQADGGTSVGAGGVGLPDFDIGQVGELPKWLKWIMDNKNIVLGVLGTIASVIASIKIVKFISSLKNVFKVLQGMSALKIFGIIAGVAITIVGIVETISGLINYIQNPSWRNFEKVLSGIEKILIGVGIAMVAFNATNPVGWIILATGAILALVSALAKDRAGILSVKEAQEELTEAKKKAKEATDAYVNAVDNAEQAEKALKEAEDRNKISGEELYKLVQEGTLDYKNMTVAQREVYKAYLNNKNAQEELIQSTSSLASAKKEEKNASFENALAIANETKNYEQFKKAVIDAFNAGEISADEARDYLERAMADMSNSAKRTFTQDIPNDIQQGLNPNKYSSLWEKFKRKWNEFMNGLKTTISIGIGTGGGFSIGGGSGGGSGGGGGRAKGGIFYPSKLPKLALGGIINLPGRGLPYNGAVIGERGAEAVVPLTDSQQMELLGSTIGKYITVNANIVTTMNGRVISRELKQVQNDQDFAYNT